MRGQMGREQLIGVIGDLGAAALCEFLPAKQVNKADTENKAQQEYHEAEGVIERDSELHVEVRFSCWTCRWRQK
jgi:hypothetical protein